MLVQLFNRGRGRGRGPVEYTVSAVVPEYDEQGRRIPGQMKTRIPPPEVLRGDPELTERLIDSSNNRWKYTAGVVAFGDDDNPSDEEIQVVIEDFEKTFFAGLERDQFDILWVSHTHEGNQELHFTIPRIELTTGKALNAFPPGYERMADAWRDKWNLSKGWARPDDPERAQIVRLPKHVLKLGQATNDIRTDLTNWLVARIEAGMIANRDDIVASLSEVGEITRQGKDYISVKPEGFEKAIRLKGVIYAADFKRERFEEVITAENTARPTGAAAVDLQLAREATERLAKHVQKRAEYNAKRYQRPTDIRVQSIRDDTDELQGEADTDHQQPVFESSRNSQGDNRSSQPELGQIDSQLAEDRETGSQDSQSQPKTLDSWSDSGSDTLSAYLSEHLGADAIPIYTDTAELNHDQRARSHDPAPSKPDQRRENSADQRRVIRHLAKGRGGWLHAWRAASDQITNTLRAGYERVREALITSVEQLKRAVQSGHDAAGAASTNIVSTSERLEQSARQFGTFLEPDLISTENIGYQITDAIGAQLRLEPQQAEGAQTQFPSVGEVSKAPHEVSKPSRSNPKV